LLTDKQTNKRTKTGKNIGGGKQTDSDRRTAKHKHTQK